VDQAERLIAATSLWSLRVGALVSGPDVRRLLG